jgi:hypothetical protein
LYQFRQSNLSGYRLAGQEELFANALRPSRVPSLRKKSPEKRFFFCVQRYRLTVGDKLLLPDTLSADGCYATC